MRQPLNLPLSCLLPLIALLTACVDQAPPLDYGDPTSFDVATQQNGIWLEVVGPPSGRPLESSIVVVDVRAYIDPNLVQNGEPAELRVTVGAGTGAVVTATAEGDAGSDQIFRATVGLVHGVNSLRVRAQQVAGTRQRVVSYTLSYSGQTPGVQILRVFPPSSDGCTGDTPSVTVTSATQVCVVGRATVAPEHQIDVMAVTAAGADWISANLEAETFTGIVTLLPDQDNTIEAAAWDDLGRESSALVTIRQDSTPPIVAILDPAGAVFETTATQLSVIGTAQDDNELAELRIETGRLGTTMLPVATTFDYPVRLESGVNPVAVVAVDTAGNEGRAELVIQRTRVIHLRPPAPNQGTASLTIDRLGMEELLDETAQRELELAVITLRPFVLEALQAIREPERYGTDTTLWGAAEWNLYRLLNMTPDTADLRGTSVEGVLEIANAIGLPAPRILADLLGVEVTEPFLPIEGLADVLLEQAVGSHPNAARNDAGEIVLAISLYDALNDLRPLGARFGPVGAHPGFISGSPVADVLEPGFSMTLAANTNLTQFDGVDGSRLGKDFIFLLQGDQVLEFDFFDPDRFVVVGLVDEPRVDLTFTVAENDAFLFTDQDQFANPVPGALGFYLGDGQAWTAAPWEVERLIVETAFQTFQHHFAESDYAGTLRYDAGAIEDAAVVDWDHGWIDISTSGGVGDPPEPTYVWGFLAEVAQVRLHDGGLAEGEADVAFALIDVPIGLTADELIEALQPSLQAQEAELSERLVGSSGLARSSADIYYVPSDTSGAGFLFFRAAEDDPGDASAYLNPGFYGDAQLGALASTTGMLPGTTDITHHKVAAQAGVTVYFEDDEGRVYELHIVSASAQDGVQLELREVDG